MFKKMNNNIRQLNHDDDLYETVKLRRSFHQFPETGFTEFLTTCKICEFLDNLGYDLDYGKSLYEKAYPGISHICEIVNIDKKYVDEKYEIIAGKTGENKWLEHMKGGFTGVIASLKCSNKGPVMGFRFDIDGLPIKESPDDSHFPSKQGFKSKNENMHACGHDGHTATGLGLAKKIAGNKDKLSGKIVLIFQPSEEGPSGGKIFSKFDIFKTLDYLIPIHIGIINQRKMVCGLSFLSLKFLKVCFKGKNAHAAVSPEKGRNALAAACTAVNNLYAISRHSDGISRINIGRFYSDNPTNIISDQAEFDLEVRGENNEICNYMYERAKEVIKGAALIHGLEVNIKHCGECSCADNSQEVVSLMKQAIINSGIDENSIIETLMVPGSEDAGFLMNQVSRSKGKASFLGIGSPTYGGHHNPEFDFDEDMMLWGVNVLWEFIKCVQVPGP